MNHALRIFRDDTPKPEKPAPKSEPRRGLAGAAGTPNRQSLRKAAARQGLYTLPCLGEVS